MIDSSAGRPVYQQPADILRHWIESGSFTEGEMLPSAAALAQTQRPGPARCARP